MVRVLLSEQKLGAGVDVCEEFGDTRPQPLEGGVAPRRLQDQQCEEELQSNAPHDDSPLYLNADTAQVNISTIRNYTWTNL